MPTTPWCQVREPSTMNPGLRALQEVTGMNGSATSMDVGFRIGPRLNAAGRMDVPEDALATLTTDCRRLANDLAQKLDAYNKERQSHEGLIRREAVEMLLQNLRTGKFPDYIRSAGTVPIRLVFECGTPRSHSVPSIVNRR